MNGADKVVINSSLNDNPELVKSLSKEYGAQSIVASVDYRIDSGDIICYNNNGNKKISVRKYKLGELPDIQIATKDLIDPMLYLSGCDH
mgnify:CR=1 FL=1